MSVVARSNRQKVLGELKVIAPRPTGTGRRRYASAFCSNGDRYRLGHCARLGSEATVEQPVLLAPGQRPELCARRTREGAIEVVALHALGENTAEHAKRRLRCLPPPPTRDWRLDQLPGDVRRLHGSSVPRFLHDTRKGRRKQAPSHRQCCRTALPNLCRRVPRQGFRQARDRVRSEWRRSGNGRRSSGRWSVGVHGQCEC